MFDENTYLLRNGWCFHPFLLSLLPYPLIFSCCAGGGGQLTGESGREWSKTMTGGRETACWCHFKRSLNSDQNHRTCGWGTGFSGVQFWLPVPVPQGNPWYLPTGFSYPWHSLSIRHTIVLTLKNRTGRDCNRLHQENRFSKHTKCGKHSKHIMTNKQCQVIIKMVNVPSQKPAERQTIYILFGG